MARVALREADTWYEEHGDAETLVLLHPGGADARALGSRDRPEA